MAVPFFSLCRSPVSRPAANRSRLLEAVIACALLMASSAAAQNMEPLWRDGAFQVTLDTIDELEPPGLRDQVKATWLSYVGRQDRLADLEEAIPGPRTDCATSDREDSGKWARADDWILKAISDHRVVMFNENHYRIEARAFVLGMLPRLKEAGFTHIGFEAFQMPEVMAERAGKDDSGPWRYSPSDGNYTHEPVFAALVRKAGDLGMEIFGYEVSEHAPEDADMAEAIAMREQGQADNLIKRLDAAGADARILIFAGWSHIAKETMRDGHRWMAARFRDQTDIDPLTIDLTTCVFPANADGRLSAARIPLANDDGPVVVGDYAGAVDAQVHLPVADDGESVPGFYRQVLGVMTSIPSKLLDDAEPVLVRALRSDRESDAVPDDQVLVYPGESLSLYLPTGHSYQLVGHRGDGSLTARKTIAVE